MSQMPKRCKICCAVLKSRKSPLDLRRYCPQINHIYPEILYKSYGIDDTHYCLWWEHGKLITELFRVNTFTVLVDGDKTEFISEGKWDEIKKCWIEGSKVLKIVSRSLTYDEILRYEQAWVME